MKTQLNSKTLFSARRASLLLPLALVVLASPRGAVFGQTPLVDHHTHISSVNASARSVEPLLPAIALPAEWDRLLRDKERWGGRDKDPCGANAATSSCALG